jgi:hypothetical protein
MFKSGKLSSDRQLKKETLEALGYDFHYMSKKTGWRWSSASNSSANNAMTEAEIIDSAWDDAAEKTCQKLEISTDTWLSMGSKEQKEFVDEALSTS